MVGDAFPLKDPRGSRLQHSGKIRFGSCPYDNLEHRKTQSSLTTTESREHDVDLSDIHATSSNFMKSQRQLLFITPAIGFASALCILLSLCVFLLYIQHRPDGVYKTNERNAFVPIGVGAVGDNKRRHGNVNDYGNAGGVRFPGVPILTHTRLLDPVKQEMHATEQSTQREYFC